MIHRLTESELLRAILESNPDGIAVVARDGRVVLFNENYLQLWGFSADQLLAMSAEQRWAWQRERLQQYPSGGTLVGLRVTADRQQERALYQLCDGRWLERHLYDHRLGEDKVGLVAHWRDITERHEASLRANHERELMHALMDNVPDQIFFKDLESRFLRINPSLARRYGIERPELAVGKSDADFYAPEHAARTRQDELDILRTGRPLVAEAQKERWADGRETWNVTTKMPLHDPHGRLIGTYGIAHDITEHKRTEALIWHQANFDALTELPNRRLLRDRWAQAHTQHVRSGLLLALLVLDLDRFKEVNDSLGHAQGDELLIQAASRIREAVRASDTVARLGGDEFALIIGDLGDALQAMEIAEKVRAALDAPFKLTGQSVQVSGSLGIAVCPHDGDDLDLLFQRADQAMYQAKAKGGSACCSYRPDSLAQRAGTPGG